MSKQKFYLGIDIGGTKLAFAIADANGRLLHKLRRPTQAHLGSDTVVKNILDSTAELIKQANLSPSQIVCIGVSCPGPVDCNTGEIHNPPNLPDWGSVPLKKILEEQFRIPAKFENDANAAALAEFLFGAGAGRKNLVYLTMSTGIGGGIIVDGRLYRGAHGSAGELGHQILLPDGPLCGCGRRGCLEALCSGTALAKIMKAKVPNHPDSIMLGLVGGKIEKLDAHILLQAARDDDKLALSILRKAGYYLGWGLANLTNILDPEIFILGTLAIHAGDLLLAPAKDALSKYIFNRKIPLPALVPAKLGEEIGEYGAIAAAIEQTDCI